MARKKATKDPSAEVPASAGVLSAANPVEAMSRLAKFATRQLMYEGSSDDEVQNAVYMRSGCLPFDLITGGKGMPRGRMELLYSEPGAGKTTLLFTAARGLCQRGYKVMFADIESSDDTAFQMGLIGPDDHLQVPKGSFMYLSASSYAELEEIADAFIGSGYDLLMIDSITAAGISRAGRKKSKKTVEDPTAIGSEARVQSMLVKNVYMDIKATNQSVVYIAQVRNKIDFKNPMNNGPKAAVSNAGLFFSNIQVKVKGGAFLKSGTAIIGREIRLYSEKNRHAPPFVNIPASVIFGRGVSNIELLIKTGQFLGIFIVRGAWWDVTIPGKQSERVQGKEGLSRWIKEHYAALEEVFYDNALDFLNWLNSGEQTAVTTADSVFGANPPQGNVAEIDQDDLEDGLGVEESEVLDLDASGEEDA